MDMHLQPDEIDGSDADEWIALSDPDMSTKEIDAVSAVLKSPRVSAGPAVEAFESEFAAYVGRAYAVAVSSGTLGTLLALKALRIGPGDEVVASSYGWHQVAQAIVLAGATPVLADIDYWSGCLAPNRVAEKLGAKTRAIIAGNANGHPAQWDRPAGNRRNPRRRADRGFHRGDRLALPGPHGRQLRRSRDIRFFAAGRAGVRRRRHGGHRRSRSGERTALPAQPQSRRPVLGLGRLARAAAGDHERSLRGARSGAARTHRRDSRPAQAGRKLLPRTHHELRGHQAALSGAGRG